MNINGLIAEVVLGERDLKNTELFTAVFANTFAALQLEDTDVSNALPVDRTTVNRWRSGKSAPRPLMRKPVYRFLKSRLRRLQQNLAARGAQQSELLALNVESA